MKTMSRFSMSLVLAFVFAVLAPGLAGACSCGYPYCSGNYCYCCGFESYCYDFSPPIMNPCNSSSLAYNASQEELAIFKTRIDAWSQREDLRTVVEAATDLYDSVLFQDSQSFVDANAKFEKAVNSLSEEARKGLIQTEARLARGK